LVERSVFFTIFFEKHSLGGVLCGSLGLLLCAQFTRTSVLVFLDLLSAGSAGSALRLVVDILLTRGQCGDALKNTREQLVTSALQEVFKGRKLGFEFGFERLVVDGTGFEELELLHVGYSPDSLVAVCVQDHLLDAVTVRTRCIGILE
jgi:hypothetical protein